MKAKEKCKSDKVRIPFAAVVVRDQVPNKDFFNFHFFCKGSGSICPLFFQALNGVQEGFTYRFKGK